MRPKCITEIASRAAAGVQQFDPAVRELLDEWQLMSRDQRAEALKDEPQTLGDIKDAYLAALAEHLALSERLPVPE